MLFSAWLCGCAPAPRVWSDATSVPDVDVVTPRSLWPEQIRVRFTASQTGSALAREPSVSIADADGNALAQCALTQGAAACETDISRRGAYTITVEDATHPARSSAAHVTACPALSALEITSEHGPQVSAANVTPWWARVAIVLHCGDYAREVELVPVSASELRVRNVSDTTVIASTHAAFTHREDGAWVPYGTSCGLSFLDHGFVTLAPRASHVAQAGPTRTYRPEGANLFRAEVAVQVVRKPGTVVLAAESAERVPVPSVTEEKLAVIALDDYSGWIW